MPVYFVFFLVFDTVGTGGARPFASSPLADIGSVVLCGGWLSWMMFDRFV